MTDKNGCSVTTSEYILADPQELSMDEVAVQHVTCKGANDGKIKLVVSGGWGNYIFTYRKAGQGSFTTFTDTTPFDVGTYTIQVTDKEGCSVTYGQTVTITEPQDALTLQYALSAYDGYQVSCFDSNDGWIDASAAGGNSAPFGNQYLFALGDGAFSTNPRFEGLSAGSYTLKVKDERGCMVTSTVTLSAPAELILSTLDKNYIQCFGDSTGYITVQASGGVSPYRYRLDSGIWQDNPVFEQLPAGGHALTVTDARGCQTVFLESMTTNDLLVISFDKTDVRCYGENNGEITANVSGGKAPYVLNWQQVSSSGDHLEALAPGWYTLTIADADACALTDSVLIRQPETELATTPVVTPVRCYGENSGVIALATTGGNLPYRYSMDQ